MNEQGARAETSDAANTKTISAVFGEMVWLMSQSNKYKHVQIWELEKMLMLPILQRRFRIFYKDGQPTAVILFAGIDITPEIKDEATRDGTAFAQQASCDIRTNNAVHVIAPFGNEEYYKQEAGLRDP